MPPASRIHHGRHPRPFDRLKHKAMKNPDFVKNGKNDRVRGATPTPRPAPGIDLTPDRESPASLYTIGAMETIRRFA